MSFVGEKERTAVSKFLSYVLRHRPDSIGIELDSAGWVNIAELLEHAREHGRTISDEQLAEVVARNPKRRFAISDDGLRIRANQGHSVDVELAYSASKPPTVLFHGTVDRALDAIFREGLKKMNRHHVHLSPELDTATMVGARRGRPVILEVAAQEMHDEGHEFYLSANGVWLTEHVAPRYLRRHTQEER
ncbi:MAG: RNA 2'-phosphotransferase [Myxococcota bacterium]